MDTHIDSSAVGKLQDLLSLNIDSEKGFQEAAETTKDMGLRRFFMECSRQRAENAAELRTAISSTGKKPSEHGSVGGTMHRWWVDAKQAILKDDAQSVLNEAERGEDTIKHKYEDALEELDDPQAREMVERQYSNVRQGHDRVRELRDSYRTRNPK